MTAPLVLLDPAGGPFWPLSATRPISELLAGTRSFRERWAAAMGPVAAIWCDSAVAGARLREPRPNLNAWPDASGGYRVASSTWIPPAGWAFDEEPAEYTIEATAVGWRLPADAARELAAAGDDAPEDLRERLRALGLPAREAGGRFLDSAWAVVDANPELVTRDASGFRGVGALTDKGDYHVRGDPADVRVAESVGVGPFAVLDAREGPIVLDRGVRVEPHSLLHGPLYVGPGSSILGAVVAGSSIGPRCKVHGDVEQTIVQGSSNKAHEGFVGHSMVGEWVNLGAGTTNSDLKNTYGTVRVDGPEGRIETGLLKVGSFLGDHVKTGIGTLLTTGARIGVGTHLFGGGVSPPWLPHFSWYDGRERVPVRWERFVATAEHAMSRREDTMTEGERELLRGLHARASR